MGSKVAAAILAGDKNSVLAACMALDTGFKVTPLVCDTGDTTRICRAKEDVFRLQERYGTARVEKLVVIKTKDLLDSYMYDKWTREPETFYSSYPGLELYQAHCLTCKSTMFSAAIAYCLKHGIKFLTDGACRSRGLCIDFDGIKNRFEELCQRFGVVLLTPVYGSLEDVDKSLADRDITVNDNAIECFLECTTHVVKGLDISSKLEKFFDKELRESMAASITFY